jgi:hypothetical protein
MNGALAVAVIVAGSVAAVSLQEPGRFKSRADMVLIDS